VSVLAELPAYRTTTVLVRGGRAVQRLFTLTAVEENVEIVSDVLTSLWEPPTSSR
jgi:hypothetical protein